MAKIQKHELTAEMLRKLVCYDPATGLFTRIFKTCNKVKIGSVCGAMNTGGYLQTSIYGNLFLNSNLAFLYVTGKWPEGTVDHRNTVRTDNRWINLRDVSQEINHQNLRSPYKNNTTGHLGVSFRHGKFCASIRVGGKKIHLGYFKTPESASTAYLEAKRLHHPGCTL